MGVKGFAWLGGFALFLGVAFFVKYSFDNNLIPPELRVAIGFLAGLGLLVVGVAMSQKISPRSRKRCARPVSSFFTPSLSPAVRFTILIFLARCQPFC